MLRVRVLATRQHQQLYPYQLAPPMSKRLPLSCHFLVSCHGPVSSSCLRQGVMLCMVPPVSNFMTRTPPGMSMAGLGPSQMASCQSHQQTSAIIITRLSCGITAPPDDARVQTVLARRRSAAGNVAVRPPGCRMAFMLSSCPRLRV
jgi:hypothetical protein